jgi:hypothetical protein
MQAIVKGETVLGRALVLQRHAQGAPEPGLGVSSSNGASRRRGAAVDRGRSVQSLRKAQEPGGLPGAPGLGRFPVHSFLVARQSKAETSTSHLQAGADGLLRQIFGPTKDYECNCGNASGCVTAASCVKCGVEVIQSKVRRERMATSTWRLGRAHLVPEEPTVAHRHGPRSHLEGDREGPLLRVLPGRRPESVQQNELLTESKPEGRRGARSDGFRAEMGAEAIASCCRASTSSRFRRSS